ncbi:MAG: condensation domain-containing protein, partial [Bacteroidota bacterium]
KPTDLVYVIYTSGTTGFPKGVMIESSSLENYTTYIKRKFDLSVADKTVLLSSMAFDLGYTGLFGSLVSGGTLHIVADDFGKSPEKTLQYIIEAGITFIKTTPSMFFILTQVPGFEKYASDLSLRLVVLGGEPINCDDIERYWRFKPETRFANHYGPTETTIGTVVCPIDAGTFDQFKKQPVIGKAVHHNKVLTLDKNYQLTPVGIPGEICIGGKGVARGYLNNPELTHDKFFEAAWLNKMRLYRTGDFGKWLSNGNLAFIGRKDNQIKIRGYRVEIDEIVRTIQSQGNIVDARVIVKKDREGRPYLVAYVIPKNNDMTLDIKPQLSDALPDYMMPTHFVNLTSFPITANGKLDEKALPDPAESAIAAELKKPESELEVMLARIWQEVLNKTNIGINQSFFEIGGDSIKAIQVASKTYELQYKLEVKDIFQFPTIQQLAREIKPLHLVADQTLVTGNFPLTPIQKRFFTGRINNKNHYNQSVMLFSEQGFDEMATRAVFQKLIEHHDLLRATFTTNENGDVEGTIAAENHFDIETIDLRKMPVPPKALLEHVERKQAQLNVFEGPLFKLTIFKLDDGDRLHMAMHHLIVDGVSWRILFEDIGRLYQAYNDHKLLELPAKTHAYKEWAEKLSAYATSEALSREFGFWENIRKAKTSAIPYDKPAGSPGTIQNNRKLAFTLSTESTQRLLNDVNRLYRTSIKDILLAALGLAVKRSFNVQQVLIEQEGHGREEILDGIDVSRTVGWFTSKYPVVLDITNADDLRRAIVEVKEYLRKVPYNGIGFGILRYLTRNADAWCIDPQISFNYLGQFDGDIAKSSFRIADEPCGNQAAIDEERPYALDISGI